MTAAPTRREDGVSGYLGPVVVGLVAGAFLVLVSGSLIVRAVGLLILGLTFLLNDVSTIKRLVFAAILLEIPIQVDVYVGHDPVQASAAAISGFNMSVTTVALVLLYAIWALEVWADREEGPRPILRRSLPILVYTALVVFSLRVAADASLALYEINILIQALLVLVYAAHAVRSKRDLLFALVMLYGGVLFQVAISGLLYFQGSPVDFAVISTREVGGRIAGTIGHPNSLGAYLSLVLPVALAMVFARLGWWFRAVAGGAFVAGTVLLVLSRSRGAYIGFTVALAVLGLILYANRLVAPRKLARGALLVVLPLALQAGVIGSRLSAFGNEAAQARLPLIDIAWRMITDNLLFGVGSNNFAAALDPYVTIEYSKAWISTVHNHYLLVWAETGVFALAALAWFLVTSVARGVRIVRRRDPILSLAAAGFVAGLAAMMVHMTVDLFHSRPLVQLLWLTAGLLIAIERLGTGPRSEATSSFPTERVPPARRV